MIRVNPESIRFKLNGAGWFGAGVFSGLAISEFGSDGITCGAAFDHSMSASHDFVKFICIAVYKLRIYYFLQSLLNMRFYPRFSGTSGK